MPPGGTGKNFYNSVVFRVAMVDIVGLQTNSRQQKAEGHEKEFA